MIDNLDYKTSLMIGIMVRTSIKSTLGVTMVLVHYGTQCISNHMEKPNFPSVRKHCHGLAINSMNEIWIHWFLRRLGQARGCQSTGSHVLTLTFLEGTLFHDFWVHNVEHNYKQPLLMLCFHLVAISTHIPCDLFYVNICKRETT